nr:reverse transcriptase domain-containing protein [Tanacetum cinerariifolium]
MSTRSSAKNLFPPLDNPELTIRRRSHIDPTLLNDFEMANDGNGDPPVPNPQTMEELCQPSLNGRVNGVTDDALRLYLFPHSLAYHATTWFDHFLRNSINTFEQMAKMFFGKYFPPSMVTKLRNEITNFCQRSDESLFEAWEHYKLSIDRCPNHNMLPVTRIDTFYNRLTLRHRYTINAAAGGTFMKRRPEECYDLIKNMTAHYNDWDTSAQRSESSSSITSADQKIIALKSEMAKINKNLMKGVYQGGNSAGATVGENVYAAGAYQGGASHGPNPAPAYQAPLYQASGYQAPLHQPQVVTTTEFTNYMKANDAILKNMQTNMTSLRNSNLELKKMFGQFMKMNTASSSGSKTLPSNIITNPKEDLKGITTRSGNAYQGPTIPTTFSSLPQVVKCETEVIKNTVPPTNNRSTKDVQPPIIQIKTPILNYVPVVAPVSALKPNQKPSIPYPSILHDQKLRDKANDQKRKIFKIFQDLNFNISFADALILMLKFGPTIKSLRSFLNTEKDLINVYEGELTLRVGKQAITFNLDQTSRYSANYNDMTVNRNDVIDMACDEYSQEVLGFSDVIASGNPTPYYDPIISNSSLTLTPFGDSDFLLKEVDAFLALDDDPRLREVDQSYYDLEGDILLLEAFLNDDPSLPPPTQGMYLPQVRKELKIYEAKNDKSLIDEPPEVELKDLPPHLEYAFLEGDDKLPVIITKDLSVEEKAALIKVLKSHKQAIAWKLSDIKGINPEFYTHKILMEDNFEPAVQHQRTINSKIHNVNKQEVLKLLDAGLIYPISDSPWLNESTLKEHFPLPFMDQMLERLVGNEYYCFLCGFSGYFQIPIDPKDQEKTTFTYPYGTFAYRRMPFGLCNAPGTFRRCMMAIFHDMIEKRVKGFAKWDLRQGHMGCWGEGVGRIWCRELPVDPAFVADFQSCVDIVCAKRINFGYGERSGPAGLEFSRKDLKAGIEEQDLITDIEDAVLDLCKWVPRSLMIAFGVPNREKRDFKNFTTTLASLVGSDVVL